MINGLGVLGWGVGGIEAEAAMLGQPMSMLIPQVLGLQARPASCQEGATATDLVLTVTEMLRERGVVGKFVEFHGAGLANLPLADRATIGNMSPEFGSTCAIFPIDAETLRYLEFSGRPKELIDAGRGLRQGAGPVARRGLRGADVQRRRSSSTWPTVVPSIAGPKRPQDRVSLTESKAGFRMALEDYLPERTTTTRTRTRAGGVIPGQRPGLDARPQRHRPRAARRDRRRPGGGRRVGHDVPVTLDDGTETELDHGHVVIAAITSCTNTSNPSVMLGAGILARNAVQKGLKVKPWVKTSLAPGSKVVTEYLERAGLDRVPRGARLQPGRLRLHHLHRQQRPAARGDLATWSAPRTWRSSRCCRATATSRAGSTPT